MKPDRAHCPMLKDRSLGFSLGSRGGFGFRVQGLGFRGSGGFGFRVGGLQV